MSDDKETENSADIEEIQAEPEASSETKEPGGFSWFWLFLLILISIGVAFTFFTSKELKHKYLNLLTESFTTEKAEQIETPASDSTPELVATPQSAPAEAFPEPVVEIELPVEEATNQASSEEISNVLDAMEALQGELRSLREQQQALEETQHSVQVMQLRTRLRWITNQANHLPQLQLAWEELTLMPILTSTERGHAQSMLALAEKRLLELQNWQQTLHTYAESLSRSEHANIIPAFENQWLNWIAEQFSVRSSLSDEEANDEELREQLINASRNIEIERWPDANAWLQLRATLQLRVIAAKTDAESSAAVDLGLPESFKPIKTDINLLRQVAETWLEDLS
ncbi:MAG: hypothetical protein ABUK11_05805 [Mariprofundaceae bacterium]